MGCSMTQGVGCYDTSTFNIEEVKGWKNFKLDFTGDSWDLYKNLRNINPAPYSSYFNFGDKFSK